MLPTSSFGGHGMRTGLTLDNAAGPPEASWVPPIIRSVATANLGVAELVLELDRHRELMEQSGKARQRRRRKGELMLLRMLQERWMQDFSSTLGPELNAALDRIELGELDPYSALDLFRERFAPVGC